MAPQELTKSIEAKKLNPRSKLPLPEPPVTIPYGGLVQDIEEEGDLCRFVYLGEIFQCPADRLLTALPGKKSKRRPSENEISMMTVASIPSREPSAQPDVSSSPAAKADFVWEAIETNRGKLFRGKVPGGWLVQSESGGIAFIADAGHGWDGRSLD